MDKPIEQLIEVIEKNIDYFRMEYELTYAETIGALEIIKMNLWILFIIFLKVFQMNYWKEQNII